MGSLKKFEENPRTKPYNRAKRLMIRTLSNRGSRFSFGVDAASGRAFKIDLSLEHYHYGGHIVHN